MAAKLVADLARRGRRWPRLRGGQPVAGGRLVWAVTSTGAFGSASRRVLAADELPAAPACASDAAAQRRPENQQCGAAQERGQACPGPASGAYARKLQSFCPRNDSGVPATIAIACATTFVIPAPHQRDQHHVGEAERDQRDGEEARRLEDRMLMLGVERPVAVEPEVVDHRDDECDHRRDPVVDLQQVNADGEHDEVDDVAARTDGREPDQLKPVVGLANAVAHADAERELDSAVNSTVVVISSGIRGMYRRRVEA